MFDFIKKSPQTEHRFCQENLSPFLDGQLTVRECTRVERHLETCTDCRADLESLRQTVALLRVVPAVKPPRSFFIPVSEGVRQRQVQRLRVAYGYLQAATAMATFLLVLVVSGDALLRFGALAPARQGSETSPTVLVQPVAVEKGEGAEASPTGAAPAAPSTQSFGVAAPPQAPEPTTAVTQPLAEAQVSQTETAPAVADSQGLTMKAMPSETFARPAGAPPLPTTTVEAGPASPLPAETMQPSREELATAVPTAMALPTQTPLPPTATPLATSAPVPTIELPSPQPAAGEVERESRPPLAPSAAWAAVEAVGPFLSWLERALGAVVAMLLAATLWLRRGQHTV